MVWPIKTKKPTIMKKQIQIEKAALSFSLQIFNLIESIPGKEGYVPRAELVRETVKISSGISTFIHLNELKAAFKFLNQAFSATFRVEVYLLVLMEGHFVDTIDKPMKSLEKLRERLDKMLNREPGQIEF